MRGGSGSRAVALRTAVRYYLSDAGSGRKSWPVPGLVREATAEGAPVEVELDEGLYRELELESRRQRVPADLLALHALIYFLADYESGRAAARLGAAISRDAEAN